MQKIIEAGGQPPVVEVRAGAYLVEALFSMGPLRVEAMGSERPADWQEIAAFMIATRRVSEPWETEALHEMAAAYFEGMRAGRQPLGRAPLDRH